MNKIKPALKGFGGILFFFGFQYLYSILISILVSKINFSFLAKNIILLLGEAIIAIVMIILNKERLKKDYPDFNKNYKKYLKIGIKYWFTGLIFMMLSNILINVYITNNIAANEASNRSTLESYPIYAILAISLIGPLAEELTFRCNFKDLFHHRSTFVLFTSLIFASAHVLTSLTSITDLIYLIPYMSLSLALGFAFYDTDNIYTTITIHTMHNTLATIILVVALLGA